MEIGSGSLVLSFELLRLFEKGTLIDFNDASREAYAALGKSQRDRLNLIIADFMEYRFERFYDAVIACEVLEHIQDESAFLGKIHGLLNPGGQLILSVPARKKLWSDHDVIVGHLRRYEKAEITNLLSDIGFKRITVIAYGFPLVNVLRLARIGLAKLQYAEKITWSKERQTKESGSMRREWFARSIGILINPVTAYPLCRLSSLFNDRDWSEGYLAFGEK